MRQGTATFIDIILAIILPPLGVFLKFGCHVCVSCSWFTISQHVLLLLFQFFMTKLQSWWACLCMCLLLVSTNNNYTVILVWYMYVYNDILFRWYFSTLVLMVYNYIWRIGGRWYIDQESLHVVKSVKMVTLAENYLFIFENLGYIILYCRQEGDS